MLLKASKTTLIFLLCFGFAIFSGCKSMEFGKPKLPKLPSLAFWKKGGDSEIPPPPARHFDPARFGSEAETQVAEQTKSVSSKFDQYGMRIDDAAEEAGKLASKGFKFPEESLEKLNSKPIRKPYGMDDLGGKELASAKNKFDLDSENLKNKIEDSKAVATNQLSNAQQDFRSAMNSAANLAPKAKTSLTADNNLFNAGDNSFAAAPMEKAIETAKGLGGVSGGSFTPGSEAFNNVKLASGQAGAAVNNALYDAKGRLTSAATKAQGLTQSPETNRLKSEFEQRLLAAQKQTEAKADAFKAGTLNASDQLTALAGVSGRTKEVMNQPFPKVSADGSFIPQNSARPMDLNAKLPALQPNDNPLLQINKPNTLAANSLGVAPQANSDSISSMRSEVEQAKRELAMLKAQVAAAKQSAVATMQPTQQAVQNTIQGVVLPLDQVNNAFDPRAGSPVVNQSQGQSSPATSQPPSNSNTGGGSNSFYPATPYGGFGSTAKPQATVGQAAFNSGDEFQNRVSQASAEGANAYSGPLKASRINSSASEVIIPSAVLSGSSSFNPGSTAPLREGL